MSFYRITHPRNSRGIIPYEEIELTQRNEAKRLM